MALTNAYPKGCADALRSLISEGSQLFGITAIAVAVVEVINAVSFLDSLYFDLVIFLKLKPITVTHI